MLFISILIILENILVIFVLTLLASQWAHGVGLTSKLGLN